MRNEERDVYVIPPNFIEGGTLLGGMFKTRNVIEAGVLGLLVGLPVLKELVGQNFTVQCQEGDYVYVVLRGDGDDWHEFNVDTLTPIT